MTRACVVAIAGCGVAASAAALALRARGFDVEMLVRADRCALPSVEALPEGAARLLDSLCGAAALRRACAVAVRGFENGWSDAKRPIRHDGWWVHVEREALARELLAEASARGARQVLIDRLPRGLDEAAAIAASSPFAFVDATGRSAYWSRPVERDGRGCAIVHAAPGSSTARPGRVMPLDGGWCYALAHPDLSTIGVVHDSSNGPEPDLVEVTRLLGLPLDEQLPTARRPCFAQWATSPMVERRISIGDAALAYEPLAGQGVRFAFASALAATATLTALRDGCDGAIAERYYAGFVASARARHVRKLAEMRRREPEERASVSLHADDRLSFVANTVRAPLQKQGALVIDEAIILPDGGLVRWLGSFDLLTLREWTRSPIRVRMLTEQLRDAGVPKAQTGALLVWCSRQQILASTGGRK